MGWTTQNFTYIPSASVTTLSRQSLTSATSGPALDYIFPSTSIEY